MNNKAGLIFNKRVLVCSYQPYIVEAMQSFADEYQWEPVIWFVADENRELVKQHFPDAYRYDYFDSVKGRCPDWLLEGDIEIPSPTELNFLSVFEHNFLFMLERNDSNAQRFGYKDRQAFYYHVIGLWKSILTHHNIDVIWFEEEPHQASDYGLYLTAQLLDIETAMTIRTISELGLLPCNRFEDGSTHLIECYNEMLTLHKQRKPLIQISDEIEAYFGTLNADYADVVKKHLWDQVEQYQRLTSKQNRPLPSLSKIKRSLSIVLDVALRIIQNPEVRSDQFVWPLTNYGFYTYRKYLYYKIKTINHKQRLRRFYSKNAITKLDALPNNKRYLYLALQYQPEKSTCPLAGRFADQLYLIKWLARELDDSWHILVKEHPSQFISSYSRFGECMRDTNYYQNVTTLDNVTLVDLSLDSFSIMNECAVVASAGGTVCWEAIARGIPALSFAHSWFRPCHGVFYIDNKQALQRSIALIDEGFKPEVQLVKAYAQLIKDSGFDAVIGGENNLRHRRIDKHSNAKVHFEAIKTLFA